MEESRVRVLLVGEPEALARCGSAALRQQVTDRPAVVTVVAVARRAGAITAWAPMSGGTTPDRMARERLAAADRAARDLASALPPEVGSRHLAVRCWADAMQLASEHNVVIVAGPLCRRDRRVARRSSAAAMQWVNG
jgi:hypothetical protein